VIVFTSLAMAGYTIYALAPGWPFVFVGLVGVMAWKAGAFPTTFAVIGDSLRAIAAHGVQRAVDPRAGAARDRAPLGGLAIASFGILGACGSRSGDARDRRRRHLRSSAGDFAKPARLRRIRRREAHEPRSRRSRPICGAFSPPTAWYESAKASPPRSSSSSSPASEGFH
jgi:hypothetical protein